MMKDKFKMLDEKHQKFSDRFDEIFEGLNKDRKAIGYKVKNLESAMERAQKDLKEVTDDVKKVYTA